MKIPENFPIHRILIDGEKNHSVSDVFASFNEIPKDRRISELFESVGFAKCLQIWHKHNLLISFVNEEKSQYKGIDFFLCSENNQKQHKAFQLVEFKAKYSSINNTEEFAKWII